MKKKKEALPIRKSFRRGAKKPVSYSHMEKDVK
jgi:hypothetical protein